MMLVRRHLQLVIVSLLPAVLSGCENPGVSVALPVMEVGIERIEYGAVPVGASATRTVFIQNTGIGQLNLDAAIEEDASSAFEVVAYDNPIPAGSQGTVQVTFRPPDIARYTGRLVLTGDDPDNPRAEVVLSGDGFRRGAIEVEPLLIDFGTVSAGQVGLGKVYIRNVGNGDLIVTGIELGPETNPDYHIQNSTQTPASIEAGAEVMLLLAYRPGLASLPPSEGRLIITAADPFQPETTVRLVARLNQAPMADAGPDQDVDPFDLVTLDGSASRDPDADLPLAFDWRLVRRPEGSSCELTSLDLVETGLTPDLVGVYEAELYVTDSTGLRSLLPDRVTVTALPAEKLLAELVWDSPIADLDLHMLAPGGTFGGLLDCHWANPSPDWGQSGVDADDPRLLRDDLAGFGPETIGYAEPLDGTYRFVVDFFAAHTPSGREPTTATLRIFIDGFLEAEIARRLESQGQRWEVVQVLWPEGGVELIDRME